MRTSERAMAAIRSIPENERPISEQYRIVAKQWVDAHSAANILEETKSAILSKMMLDLGDMPVSRAEMIVKASEGWREHLTKMTDARRQADLLKVQLKYLEMKFAEWQANDATARAEMRMSR
jgi:hypothetical protein